jgi:hypothetical protein
MCIDNWLESQSMPIQVKYSLFHTPEQSCISKNLKVNLIKKTDKIIEHHDLLPCVVKRKHNIISEIK